MLFVIKIIKLLAIFKLIKLFKYIIYRAANYFIFSKLSKNAYKIFVFIYI